MAETDSPETISWTASEYIDHQRGAGWYLLLLIVTAGLAGAIYLITKDRFASGVVIVLGLIAASSARWKPREVEYRLTAKGLHVGDKFYAYSQFRTFSIYHEGELSSLIFQPIKRFSPPISIFFDVDDEDRVAALAGEHLPMEETTPDGIDRLSRRLRL